MDRKLYSLLSEKKETIASRWLDRLIDSYPPDTSKFLRKERDRFANPVGQSLARGIHALVDVLLLEDAPAEELAKPLDAIVRIRAVQELSASQALRFVFVLKEVVHEALAQQREELGPALRDFEQRIDELALLAFEIYLGCKEQLYDIRVREMKRRTAKLVERMNRIYGEQDGQEPPTT